MFCRSLCLSFFLWQLCHLSFLLRFTDSDYTFGILDLRILITPLVSSNCSHLSTHCIHNTAVVMILWLYTGEGSQGSNSELLTAFPRWWIEWVLSMGALLDYKTVNQSWTILGNLFGECHAPFILKTSFTIKRLCLGRPIPTHLLYMYCWTCSLPEYSRNTTRWTFVSYPWWGVLDTVLPDKVDQILTPCPSDRL